MNNLFNLFSTEFVAALGWSLLHSLWQGALIAFLLGIALLFLQKRSSNLRYTLAASGLGLTLAAFFGTFAYLYQSASAQSAALEEQIIIVTQEGYENLVHHSAEGQTLLSIFLDYFNQHLPIIVVFWCLGVLVLSLRFLGGLAFLQRLRHSQNRPLGEEWEMTMNAIAQQIGVKKSIELVESALIKVPMVVGYLKPMILLPIGTVNALSAAEVEAILAHELAHIRRHDYIINLIQSIIDVLFFYHPAIWWMSSTVRAERENCCDDLALSVTGNSLIIAKALANLEALRQSSYQLSLAFTGNKNQLLKRISRLLGQPMKRNNHFVEGIVAIVIILLCMTTINYRVNASNSEEDTNIAVFEADTTEPTEIIVTDEDGEVIEEYIIIEEEVEEPISPLAPLTATFSSAIDLSKLSKLENTWFSTDLNIDASHDFNIAHPKIAYHFSDEPKKLALAKTLGGIAWVQDVEVEATSPNALSGRVIVRAEGSNEFEFEPFDGEAFETNAFMVSPDGQDYKVDFKVKGLNKKDFYKTITVSPDTSILDDAEVIIVEGDKITIIRKKQRANDDVNIYLERAKRMEREQVQRQLEMARRQSEMAKRMAERETEALKRRLEVQKEHLEREEEMLRRAKEMEERAKVRAEELKRNQKDRAVEMEVRAKERAKEMERRAAEMEVRAKERAKEMELRMKMREKEMKEREKYLKQELKERERKSTQILQQQLIEDGFLKEGEEIKTINIYKDNDDVKIKVNGKKIPEDKAREYIKLLETEKN